MFKYLLSCDGEMRMGVRVKCESVKVWTSTAQSTPPTHGFIRGRHPMVPAHDFSRGTIPWDTTRGCDPHHQKQTPKAQALLQ